jgi:hypothetical protein
MVAAVKLAPRQNMTEPAGVTVEMRTFNGFASRCEARITSSGMLRNGKSRFASMQVVKTAS